MINGTLNPGNPECYDQFHSIPATLYLSMMMLTGQGGPTGQLDTATKLVCGFTALLSVAQFAIPSSMLTWGFEAEAERLLGKKRERRKKEKEAAAKGQVYVSTSESSGEDGSGQSSWDEYEAVILGDEEEEEAKEAEHKAEHEETMDMVRAINKRLVELGPIEAREHSETMARLDKLETGMAAIQASLQSLLAAK